LQAFEELEKLLPENDICIAVKEKLVKDSGIAGEAIYGRIVDKLLALPKAKGTEKTNVLLPVLSSLGITSSLTSFPE